MDALTALKERRSVRKYEAKPISRELLAEAVDCARYAPTGRNAQPWEFVVVTTPEGLHKLAELTDHGKFMANAGACVAVFCRESKYYLEDGAAATQNLMVAAHALGLGTCWIAANKKPYTAVAAELLGAPADYRLVSLVAIGYPAEIPVRTKRPLNEVLHWERFGEH